MNSGSRELPIAEYGLIGDGRTAALCASDGSIDWLCLPRFDSAPIFGRLVGGERSGCFSIEVEGRQRTTRRYRDGSAVLETTWTTADGRVTLTEGLVLHATGWLAPQALLVRRLEARGNQARIRVRFDPRAGISGGDLTHARRAGALVSSRGSLALALRCAPDVNVVPGRPVDLLLQSGRPLTLALGMSDRQPLVIVDPEAAFRRLEDTERWWRQWSSRLSYEGPEMSSLVRSLITLRLLTYSPSGAPVAAPTTSLPEDLGGIRNWDYRFSWPRDASIGAQAFLHAGLSEEAHSFLHWLLVAGGLTRPRLHVAYTLDGKPVPKEHESFDVPGYRQSRPVRIGNAAATQHQLDIYGWVAEAAWAYVDAGLDFHRAIWRGVKGFADFVAREWRHPDAGVWEVRGNPVHHVHSKMMGWLTLDRAIRISRSQPVRRSRVQTWRRARDAIAAEIRDRGFDERRGSYTRAYGSEELDAALLILPSLGFDPPGSPRVTGTIETIRRELSAGGPLLFRYPRGRDGLEGGEGAFLACSFWLVLALARTGRAEEARALFEELCALGNDLGLFAEEMDPDSREHLGNFPQALTHATLAQAAFGLQGATGG